MDPDTVEAARECAEDRKSEPPIEAPETEAVRKFLGSSEFNALSSRNKFDMLKCIEAKVAKKGWKSVVEAIELQMKRVLLGQVGMRMYKNVRLTNTNPGDAGHGCRAFVCGAHADAFGAPVKMTVAYSGFRAGRDGYLERKYVAGFVRDVGVGDVEACTLSSADIDAPLYEFPGDTQLERQQAKDEYFKTKERKYRWAKRFEEATKNLLEEVDEPATKRARVLNALGLGD